MPEPLIWYTPAIISTEQEREGATFGTLETPDEVKGVVLPKNGLIAVTFTAIVESTVSGAGRVAIFVGTKQQKARQRGAGAPLAIAAPTKDTGETNIVSTCFGLVSADSNLAETSNVTTGQSIGFPGDDSFGSVRYETGETILKITGSAFGGPCLIFASAGTYNISVQYLASSGKVSAKERKLWVYTLGL